MRNVSLERNQVNIETLDADLRTELGDAYLGLSARDGVVILHASDEISDAQIQSGRTIVQAHDATVLSAEQQGIVNLRSEIDSLKASVGDIDNLTTTEATDAIKLLYKALRLNGLL